MIAAFSLGVLSSIIIGPGGHNLFRIQILKKRFPMPELIGLLAGEGTYLGLVLVLLEYGLSLNPSIRTGMEVISGLLLIGYGVLGLRSQLQPPKSNQCLEGFSSGLYIALANPALFFLYFSFLAPQYDKGWPWVSSNILIYFASFLIPTLYLLRKAKSISFSPRIQKVEKILFLTLATYGIHIIWRTL